MVKATVSPHTQMKNKKETLVTDRLTPTTNARKHSRRVVWRRTLVIGLAFVLWLIQPPLGHAQILLDLRDVDLRRFVQIVAEETRRNFVLDTGVTGSVTVIAPTPVSSRTVYEIFLNVLELNDLTIVEGAGVDRIVAVNRAPGLAPNVGGARREGAFETRVVPVQTRNLDELVEALLPLIPPEAVLRPVPSAGVLVLSDRRENIARVEQLIALLSNEGERTVEALTLRHARAEDLQQVIEGLGIIPVGASLSADPRANSIVVAGPPEFRNRIRGIIAQLDTPQQRLVTRVVRLDFADARELAEVVRQSITITPDQQGGQVPITIVAEPQNNAILLTAPGDRIDSLVDAVSALDARPAQVLIEAVIFEISAENFSDLSAQFGALLNDAIGGGTSFELDGRLSLVSLISAAFANRVVSPGSGGVLGTTNDRFALLLTALARERSTRLLSTPAILTLNNQQAEIVVAQNVPFVTGRFSTVGDSAVPQSPFQTIERQDVGLTLTVRPQITQDDMVRMSINQEVSNLTGSASVAGGEITARRRLSTNVLVSSGQVIILGGLIEESSRTSSERVPGLSSLPIIGGAFRGRNTQDGQRVLLVMLRPRVIRNRGQADIIANQIARQTEELSRQIAPRNDGVYPQVRRTGFPFDGVDLNQPFDGTFVDRAVRDRLFPALPPRLQFGTGQ